MARHLINWLVVVVLVVAAVTGALWYAVYLPARHRQALLTETANLVAANDMARAEESVRQVLAEYPDDPQALLLSARWLRRSGKIGAARSALEQAKRSGLPEKDCLRETALMTASKDFGKAEPTLRQLQEERPNDAEVVEALARGAALRGNLPEAEALFAKLIELQPQRIDLLTFRAKMFMSAKYFGKAAVDFREFLRHSPADFNARYDLADCLLQEADLDAAERELQTLIQDRPEHPQVLTGLAICAMARGDVERAHQLLQQALREDPQSTQILNELGYGYMTRRRHDLAIPIFEQVLAIDKDDFQAHLRLANCLQFRNGEGEALATVAASTVGLLSAPMGQGPVVATSALFPGRAMDDKKRSEQHLRRYQVLYSQHQKNQRR